MSDGVGLLSLPPEIIVQVMYEMDVSSLYWFSITCSTMYSLVDDDLLWMTSYNKDFPNIVRAMKQPPPPDYFKFKDTGSRHFGALLHIEKLNNSSKQIITEGELVLSVLQKNKTNKMLVLTGCYLLRRLTYTPSDSSAEYLKEMSQNRITLGDNNVTQFLLGVLNPQSNYSHNDPIIVAAAICAINNLACDGNCAKIVDSAGIQQILSAMERYPNDVGVIDYSGSALANILREVEDKKAVEMVRDKGIKLVHSLLNHPNIQPKNLISIFDLSTVLATKDESYCKNEGKKLLRLAKDILSKYTQEETLSVVSCVVVHELCQKSDEFREEGIKVGLLQVLMSLLEGATHSDVIYASALALCFLMWGKTEELSTHFKQFVKLTAGIIKKHLNDKKLQLGMAIIMANFASAEPAVREILQSMDLNGLLLHALKNYEEMDDPQMTELANAYGELVGMFGGVIGVQPNRNHDGPENDG